MQNARQALIEARKASAEAKRVLEFAALNFPVDGTDIETLLAQFENEAGPSARREVERMVADAMQTIELEANQAVLTADPAQAGAAARRYSRGLI